MKDLEFTAPEVKEEQDIISMEYETSDNEEFDYDFDYDPNDMYYELNGYNE